MRILDSVATRNTLRANQHNRLSEHDDLVHIDIQCITMGVGSGKHNPRNTKTMNSLYNRDGLECCTSHGTFELTVRNS